MADKLQQGKFDSFTIVNNGLIETDLLTEHEKMIYIVIRKHLNQEKQTAFPGMATIAREARISKSQVLRAIKGLEEKGLLIVKRQTTKYNEKKTNIYRFNDFAELWNRKVDFAGFDTQRIETVVESISADLYDSITKANLDYLRHGMKIGARLLAELVI